MTKIIQYIKFNLTDQKINTHHRKMIYLIIIKLWSGAHISGEVREWIISIDSKESPAALYS